jgi:hypothetical protein
LNVAGGSRVDDTTLQPAAGRLGAVEDCLQGLQIAIAHDLVKPLFGSDEGRGQPANYHLVVSPLDDAAGLDAPSFTRTLDDIGRGQCMRRRKNGSVDSYPD